MLITPTHLVEVDHILACGAYGYSQDVSEPRGLCIRGNPPYMPPVEPSASRFGSLKAF